MTSSNTMNCVVSNCPILEQTSDGKPVGRCYFHLPDGKTCPRHGDVSKAIEYFEKTGKCLLEEKLRGNGLPPTDKSWVSALRFYDKRKKKTKNKKNHQETT